MTSILPGPAKVIMILTRILIAAAIFHFASRTYVDTDLWWHLKVGIDLWQSKIITTHDPYSFLTFNSHWIDEEWLFELIIAYIYLHFGWLGLVLFKAFLSLSILALIFPLLKEWELDDFGKGVFLLLLAIFLSPAINTVRPHIASCLFLTILLLLLRNFPKYQRRLFLLPFIFLLWVNMHGGFIVGLLTLLTYSAIYTFLNPSIELRNSKIFLWAITLICWLTSLVNPYGVELPMLVLKLCVTPHPDISEWQPVELASNLGILWATIVTLGILSLNLYKGPSSLSRILVWFPFAAAPLISLRHLPFFDIATVSLIGEHLAFMWNTFRPKRPIITSQWRIIDIAFALASIGVAFWLITYSLQFYLKPHIVVNQDVPEAAVGLLKRAGVKGNLIVDFDWGGYAIWNLFPDIKVSFDGRREFAYSPAATLANIVFTSGEGPWDYLLSHFPIDAVLTHKRCASYNLMNLKPGWKLAYDDGIAVIFLPVNSPKLSQLRCILSQIPIEKQAKQLSLPVF